MHVDPSSPNKYQALARHIGSVITIPFIFAIYFSTSLSTITSIVLGVLWLGSAQFRDLPRLLRLQPVALWALLLCACFLIGLTYSSAAGNKAISLASKYRELFYIPILMAFFNTERYRRWAWLAFVSASVASLLISYLKLAGILELNHFGDASFKSHITHNIFMAYFAFYCAQHAFSRRPYAKLYLALLFICLHNLFFVVHGLTGQAVFLILVLLFTWQRFSKKYLLVTLGALALAMLLFINFSDKAERLNQGIIDTKAYFQQDAGLNKIKSPMGQRYMFWHYSVQLIAERPLFGFGTGSYGLEYKRIAQGEPVMAENAHNEYLMITVQLGLFGLLVYLGFLRSQFSSAKRLHPEQKFLAQGVLASLLVTSMFNSPILDFSEGHWFATLIALCFAPLSDRNNPANA
ncbi:MAG: O-antigen ligase family protein [Methylococcales bacterium]